ncbi:DUF7224 domain-containing protein [Streptomyces niger]|uniref:DUF7224 domain-containing protein n=1 Tax=Streptomyces niger TaxID=66373 RepID=UPI00069A379E|nr:hypothetical protein [Streptomyces niger]
MRWRTVLRSSSATWLAPLLAAFVAFLVRDDLVAGVTAGYWPSVFGAATFALPFVTPACAAAGAWEGSRIARGNVATWAPARGGLAIAWPLLLPVLALGLLGMAVAVAFTLTATAPAGGMPPLSVAAMWLVVLLANAMAGFLLGRKLPLVIAAPLALILSFVLTAYPATLEPLWLRHMVTGGVNGCCSLDQTINWRPVASATVLALAVILAAALALTATGKRAVRLAATGLLTVGLLGSGALAYGLPATPTTPRSTTALTCSGTEPQVCVWPELSSHLPTIQRVAADTRQRLQHAGLNVPAKLTMAEHAGTGAQYIGSWEQATADNVRIGIAAGLLPANPPACADRGEFPGEVAFGPLGAWLSLTAGASKGEVAGRYGQQETALAARIRTAPAAQQRAWFQRNEPALHNCTTKPQLKLTGQTAGGAQ